MDDFPLISVIIPIFNKEDLLSRCVESVLKQSFIDFELILVNDGSMDASGKLCDEWCKKDKRIKAIHQYNLGVSAARNKGIACSQGKYVVFVDADDWVMPDYLLHLLELVPKDDRSGLVVQGFQSYSPDGKRWGEDKFFQYTFSTDRADIGKMIEKFDLGECGFSVSKLYNRSLLETYDIHFDERISFCEDLLFMYDYLLHADFLVIGNAQDYAYVKYPSSLSAVLHPFEMEYLCFMEYQKRVQALMSVFNLSSSVIPHIINAMMKCFQRALKTDYQFYHRKKVSGKMRLDNLKKLIVTNYEIMCRCYYPVCKSDRLGKILLRFRYFTVYDIYMRFLFKLGFVPIFRGPVKNKSREVWFQLLR